jgi:hypothetical protein
MRMLLPPVRERRQIDRLLAGFFHEHRLSDFRSALSRIARFYRLPTPRITWFEYLDWGKTAGRTYENGEIHLVHPENWKRGRKYNSERQWVSMIYHEMGHYVLWTDAERKADTFAMRMVRGIGVDRARGRSPFLDAEGAASDRVGQTALMARRRPQRRRKKSGTARARRG